jgi:hypothetical protein
MSTTDSQEQRQEQHSDRSDAVEDPARIQPWFVTMAASLLPAGVSFYLPDAFRVPLFVTTGVLYLVACAMLYRQTKAKPRGSDR